MTGEKPGAVDPAHNAALDGVLYLRGTLETRNMFTLQDCVELGVVARTRMAKLTRREWQVLELVVEGRANKVMAYELGISPRTVEIHRASVMRKMQTANICELVRLALGATAARTERGDSDVQRTDHHEGQPH